MNIHRIKQQSQKGRMKSLEIPEICQHKKNSYFRKIQLQSNVSKKSVLVRRCNYEQQMKRSVSFRPMIRKCKGDHTSRKYLNSQDSIIERKLLDDIGKKTQRKDVIGDAEKFEDRNNDLRTLQDESVDALEKKEDIIRNCIEQLQGVLKVIVRNKYTHNHTKHRRLLTQCQDTYRESRGKQNQIERLKRSKNYDMFDQYVDKLRNVSKNGSKTQKTIKNDRKQAKFNIKSTIQISSSKIQQQNSVKQGKNIKNIEQNQIQCSSIDKINQSSFLSENGKKIIKEVPDQFYIADPMQKSNKKRVRAGISFSKAKMNFPHDFFC